MTTRRGAQAAMRARPMRATGLVLLATGAVATACVPSWRHNVRVAGLGVVRVARVFYASARVMFDFKLLKWRYEGHPEYTKKEDEVVQRSIDRLLDLCKTNGGIFIKLAQHISSFGTAPPQVVKAFAVLQDKASFKSYEAVERLFLQDTGKRPLELFESFESTPMAAASLAQVHRARTRDGQIVAVKVQYPDVSDLYEVDLWGIEIMTKLAARWFHAFDYTWVVHEFRTYLLKEVDFVQESFNAERAARLFADQKNQLKIPEVRWDLTAPRILTMEFIDGVKINDIEAMKAIGIDPVEVARIVVSVFSDMVFTFGWLHADPHPGNLMVRKGENGQTQVVLLDHGLYRDLGETVRLAHCRFWKAMIELDGKEMENSAEVLGASKYAWIFPILFNFEPATGQISDRSTREDRQRMQSMVNDITNEDMTALLEGMPREIILLLRSMGLIYALNVALGGSSYTRLTIMANAAVHGLFVEPGLGDRKRLKSWMGYWLDTTRLNFRVWSAWVISTATVGVRGLLGYTPPPSRKTSHGQWHNDLPDVL